MIVFIFSGTRRYHALDLFGASRAVQRCWERRGYCAAALDIQLDELNHDILTMRGWFCFLDHIMQTSFGKIEEFNTFKIFFWKWSWGILILENRAKMNCPLRPLRLPHAVCVCGPPCSLFIWISSGTHRRCSSTYDIYGNVGLKCVRMSNAILRNFASWLNCYYFFWMFNVDLVFSFWFFEFATSTVWNILRPILWRFRIVFGNLFFGSLNNRPAAKCLPSQSFDPCWPCGDWPWWQHGWDASGMCSKREPNYFVILVGARGASAFHWFMFAFWNLFGMCCSHIVKIVKRFPQGWRGRWRSSRKPKLRVGGHDWLKLPENVAMSQRATTRHGFETNFQSLLTLFCGHVQMIHNIQKNQTNHDFQNNDCSCFAWLFFSFKNLQMLQDRFPGTCIWGKRLIQYGSLSGCFHFEALWHLADWISTLVSCGICGQWFACLMA